MKLVIIGEAPAAKGFPGDALTGTSGRRLCEIAGWDYDYYLKETTRTNLIQLPTKVWYPSMSRNAADAMRPLLDGRNVILLGGKVAAAFRWSSQPDYEWFTSHAPDGIVTTWMRVPHPSGRNRKWNDEAQVARARAALNGAL